MYHFPSLKIASELFKGKKSVSDLLENGLEDMGRGRGEM